MRHAAPTDPPPGTWLTATGIALGTTYRIRYLTPGAKAYHADIEALLRAFARSLSLYDPDSELCHFNGGSSHTFESPFFYPVLKQAAELHRLTGGAFDPTVFPLVEAYGFGPKGRFMVNTIRPSTLLAVVGLPHIAFDERSVWKLKKGVRLDFNAIAKGYAVDCVGALLETSGIRRYLIEIGGEVRCRGLNEQDQPWRIGIVNPLNDHELHTVLPLTDRAMATSGNYLNQFKQHGQTFTHIINPTSGLMQQSSLLSATVLADDCMTADALATTFMVMGLYESQAFLSRHPAIDAYLLVRDGSGALQAYLTGGVAATP